MKSRFVGFNPAQKNQLDALNDNKLPVLLTNCDIKFNQYSQSLEVVIKGHTKVKESTMKFDIHDPNTIGTTTITLDHLSDMKEYDKINVEVKIIDINSPQVVNSGKTKQEVIIADKSATLTLWENELEVIRMLLHETAPCSHLQRHPLPFTASEWCNYQAYRRHTRCF
jgi:hypothetical protein